MMGYALHVCVESSIRAAHDLGYEVVLIEDASAAFTREQKEHVLSEILSVDVKGAIAMVKAQVVMAGVVFTDYISLLKIDGVWVIRHKSFDADS